MIGSLSRSSHPLASGRETSMRSDLSQVATFAGAMPYSQAEVLKRVADVLVHGKS